jgi:hypothetical protein
LLAHTYQSDHTEIEIETAAFSGVTKVVVSRVSERLY